MYTKKHIQLTIILQKENDGRWTAECQELGTATFGYSIEDAQNKIEEAICLHVEGLQETGELERFFRENGIIIRTQKPPKSIKVDAPTAPYTFVHAIVQPVPVVGA